ncbi:MAG TPA: TlyA family RNA methyltransferase [bacterium]|nr:TlyA family RNA methyltransferase [bacterium]
MTKKRLDVLIFEKGLVPSREKARALIMAGQVLLDGKPATKAGIQASEDSVIKIKENKNQFVSRGGDKLAGALKTFNYNPENKVVLDIGASTGGFTDCLLKNGAKLVYAVDVGYGQLDHKLRNDDRVRVMEKTNARYLKKNQFDFEFDLAVVDVSFISVIKVLAPVFDLLKKDGTAIVLIKPQFEAGKEKIGKGGIVKNPETHIDIIKTTIAEADKIGLHALDITYSPIKGPKGNIEFLARFEKEDIVIPSFDIDNIVHNAHIYL